MFGVGNAHVLLLYLWLRMVCLSENVTFGQKSEGARESWGQMKDTMESIRFRNCPSLNSLIFHCRLVVSNFYCASISQEFCF